MALYDSQYSLDQAYSPFTNKMMRPGGKKEFSYDQGGSKEFFYNQDDGLGLSSLMGPQPQATQNPNIDSGFYNSPEYQGLPTIGTSDVVQKKYFGTGSGSIDSDSAYEAYLNRTGQTDRIIPGYAPAEDVLPSTSPFLKTRPGDEGAPPMPLPIMPGPVDYDEPETGFKSTLIPPQQTINTSAGPMLPPTPMPNPPVSLPRPTTMPMPGDVGYVPYGSRNNQLVPPGYEKPSFVQGLAGGGPVGNLSFVELLQQIMEN